MGGDILAADHNHNVLVEAHSHGVADMLVVDSLEVVLHSLPVVVHNLKVGLHSPVVEGLHEAVGSRRVLVDKTKRAAVHVEEDTLHVAVGSLRVEEGSFHSQVLRKAVDHAGTQEVEDHRSRIGQLHYDAVSVFGVLTPPLVVVHLAAAV